MDKIIDKLPEWVKKLLPFIDKFTGDRVNIYATQAAFYFIISAVPFLIFLLSILRFFIPITEMDFITLISETMPDSIQYWIFTIIQDIYTDSTISLTSFAVVTTLWAASKSTFSLSDGLLEIYESRHLTNTFKNRLLSLVYTYVFVIVVIATLLFVVFSKPLINFIQSFIPHRIEWLISLLNVSTFISLGVICLVFTVMYKVLSHSKLKFKDHFPGAVVSTLGWSLFSWLFRVYVNNFSKFNVTYGSLASIVVMMLWLKFCMTIFLLGGEINVYYKMLMDEKRLSNK